MSNSHASVPVEYFLSPLTLLFLYQVYPILPLFITASVVRMTHCTLLLYEIDISKFSQSVGSFLFGSIYLGTSLCNTVEGESVCITGTITCDMFIYIYYIYLVLFISEFLTI